MISYFCTVTYLSKLFMPRGLLLIVFFAILIRVIVMAWSLQFRENTDILRWRDWGRIAFLYDFASTYKPDYLTFGTLPNNMPPMTLYIVSSVYSINILATKALLKITEPTDNLYAFINGPWTNGFLRIPSLIADMLLGLLIYLFVRRISHQRNALIASSLFMFNPIVIFNSAFWGQMDAINNLFFYIALYFLYKKRYFLTITSFLLSLYVKLSLLYFLPVLAIIIYQQAKKKINNIALSTFASLLLIFVLTLPISSRPDIWLFNFLSKNSLGEMQHITNFAFNFWWFVFKPFIATGSTDSLFTFSEISLHNSPLEQELFLFIPLYVWGSILFIFSVFLLLYKLHHLFIYQKSDLDKLFLILSLVALLAFLFLPRMHERYLYPLFPLFATYIGLSGKRIWLFFILSILHLVNLYIVWHPMKIDILSNGLIQNELFQWAISAGITIAALYWYIHSFIFLSRYNKNEKR